jgi:hypothetical protein
VRHLRRLATLTLAVWAALASDAAAQAADVLPGRWEAAFGGRLTAAAALGATDATLTNSAGDDFTFFSTVSRMDSTRALEARLGVMVARRLQLEASASFGTSFVRTRIGSDSEGIPDASAIESVKELTVEGAVVWYLARAGSDARVVPLLWAGGGFLGHLHEERLLMERGAILQSGAGIDLVLSRRPQSGLKAVGVRIDGRGIVRVGAAATDRRARIAPAAAASLFVRF